MSIKLTFVFGLLLASGWAQENISEPEQVLEPEKVAEPEIVTEPAEEASVEAKADVDLGDSIVEGDNMKRNIDENVENTDNDVKASGKDNT